MGVWSNFAKGIAYFLAGIVCVMGVSPRWLQSYVYAKYATGPRSVSVTEQTKGTPDSGA